MNKSPHKTSKNLRVCHLLFASFWGTHPAMLRASSLLWISEKYSSLGWGIIGGAGNQTQTGRGASALPAMLSSCFCFPLGFNNQNAGPLMYQSSAFSECLVISFPFFLSFYFPLTFSFHFSFVWICGVVCRPVRTVIAFTFIVPGEFVTDHNHIITNLVYFEGPHLIVTLLSTVGGWLC